MLKRLLYILLFLLVPSVAYAWGPATHVYLANEMLLFAPALPPAVLALLKKYRQDFIYGNLMADTIIAKKYIPTERHPHNWDVTLSLKKSAETDAEYAFTLGYMAHLAADTVAHGDYTLGTKNLHHGYLELRADRAMDRSYWLEALTINTTVQRRNDRFLGGCVSRAMFSFNTNKRLYKGFVTLTGLNMILLPGTSSFSATSALPDTSLGRMISLSKNRMADVLTQGDASEVLALDPIGDLKPGKLMQYLIS